MQIATETGLTEAAAPADSGLDEERVQPFWERSEVKAHDEVEVQNVVRRVVVWVQNVLGRDEVWVQNVLGRVEVWVQNVLGRFEVGVWAE